MHYTGMAAMHMDALIRYDPLLFALSIVVAALLGIAALCAHDLKGSIFGWEPGPWRHPISAALIGLAITGMHYTAMGATYFFPFDYPNIHHAGAMNRHLMSLDVIMVTVLIIALAIAAAIVDGRLKAAAQLLRVSRQRMVEAIESISDGFILFDANGGLVMCNKVFRGMYPELRDVLEPKTPYKKVLESWAKLERSKIDSMAASEYVKNCLRHFEDGVTVGDKPEEDRLGDGRWVYIRQRPMESGGIVGVWADVTPIKELQNLYEDRAHHDPLTGLPNRKLFDDRLDHAVLHGQRRKTTLALLYVDLDHFKPINDTYGHAAGDEVLKEVGRRLSAAVRDSDTVARLGGDEFAIILEPEGDREIAEQVAKRIIEGLSRPIDIGVEECTIGASIGIAISSLEDFDRLEFINNADAAMYEAKKDSGSSFRIHNA